ncbi:MAG: hypothetical protein WBA76_20305, partial [Phormidesmis sp.]
MRPTLSVAASLSPDSVAIAQLPNAGSTLSAAVFCSGASTARVGTAISPIALSNSSSKAILI